MMKNDPPCIRAKREYDEIVDDVDGWFGCTGDLKDKEFIEFEVTQSGTIARVVAGVVSAAASTAAAAAPRRSGRRMIEYYELGVRLERSGRDDLTPTQLQ